MNEDNSYCHGPAPEPVYRTRSLDQEEPTQRSGLRSRDPTHVTSRRAKHGGALDAWHVDAWHNAKSSMRRICVYKPPTGRDIFGLSSLPHAIDLVLLLSNSKTSFGYSYDHCP